MAPVLDFTWFQRVSLGSGRDWVLPSFLSCLVPGEGRDNGRGRRWGVCKEKGLLS